MELEYFEIVNGVFSLIFIIISIIVGLIIASKYPKHKNKNLLIIGFVWVGLAEAWIANSFSFLFTIITGELLSTEIYYLIGITFTPITLFIWMVAFTDLVYSGKNRKIILLIFAAYGIVFEIVFFYFLFNDVSFLGELVSPVNSDYGLFLQLYLFSVIIITLITGILFARESLKSDNPEIKLKGKFLFLAFIFFGVGAVLDTITTDSVAFIALSRIILISSSLAFYCDISYQKNKKFSFIPYNSTHFLSCLNKI